ncbi:MAG: DUF5667 domain-containing protein [Patescibacteria group bacterium]
MKRFIIAGTILALLPFVSFAQTATTTSWVVIKLPAPGLTPADFFYFMDRFGEEFNDFFTFRVESKARIALKHAQERAAEIQAMVKTKGVDSSEVKKAHENFVKNLKNAVAVVAQEKVKGNDVSALSREVDDEFEDSKEMLKEAFRGHYEDLKKEEKRLEVALRAAIAAGNASTTTAIQAELVRVAAEKLLSVGKERDVDDDSDEDKDDLEETMGDQVSAMSHIKNAEEERMRFVALAQVHGVLVDADALKDFDAMLAEAKASFGTGDFESAKEYAKDARDILKDAKDFLQMEDMEDGDDEDEDGDDEDIKSEDDGKGDKSMQNDKSR